MAYNNIHRLLQQFHSNRENVMRAITSTLYLYVKTSALPPKVKCLALESMLLIILSLWFPYLSLKKPDKFSCSCVVSSAGNSCISRWQGTGLMMLYKQPRTINNRALNFCRIRSQNMNLYTIVYLYPLTSISNKLKRVKIDFWLQLKKQVLTHSHILKKNTVSKKKKFSHSCSFRFCFFSI